MKRFAGLFVSGLMLAASVVVGGQAEASTARVIPAQGKAIDNQYIVVLKAGASPQSVAAVAAVHPTYVYESALNGFAAELNAGQLTALQRNPSVDYIEQDGEVSINATQYMDANGDPWGLDRIDQRYLPLSGTYTYNTLASNVSAYVIDTGIHTAHGDFGGRATNVYDALGGTGNDCNGHGTHLAGTIGGLTWGVAKGVRLRGVRVLDCNGSGTYSGVIAGIDWVRVNAVRPAVANLSLGGGANTSVDTAVNNLANSGVFVAVAAGGSGGSACNYSPARAAGAYTVAASDRNDNRASFSNYGSCVDIYAPGVSIKSTWLNYGVNTLSGTSMATAHVTGCAAKYKAVYGDAATTTVAGWLSNNATKNVIKNNPTGTPNALVFCNQ
ncbi:MAG TPA: S8 family peptidase [Herpetosiphonaceae bacterium]